MCSNCFLVYNKARLAKVEGRTTIEAESEDAALGRDQIPPNAKIAVESEGGLVQILKNALGEKVIDRDLWSGGKIEVESGEANGTNRLQGKENAVDGKLQGLDRLQNFHDGDEGSMSVVVVLRR